MATSIIKLHTFFESKPRSPPCFLLQVDDFYCLLDCGWSEEITSHDLAELPKWVKKIDAVLISHPSMRHLGLLPHLFGKHGLKCPIYSTTPVYKLGQLFCYDAYQSRFMAEDITEFSLDDVDDVFQLFVQVKYQQTVNLQGKGRGLSITALPSGHMLGGTIWKLVKDETDIIYAVDFNHKKCRHLNGATFDACIRPRILLIDVSNGLYAHSRRKEREESLRQLLLKTLRRGGNVLIAVDTAGYCLEIANFLENLWHSPDSGFMAYGLAMLSHVAFNVFDFSKSLVEWMSEKIMRTFEDQRSNPFHLRHLQLCHTIDQLDCVSNPKVILATDASLSTGFSRLLFADWAHSELNSIIITSRDGDFREVTNFNELADSRQPSSPFLARRLVGLASNEAWGGQGLTKAPDDTLLIPITLSQRVYQKLPEEQTLAQLDPAKRSSTAAAVTDTPQQRRPSESKGSGFTKFNESMKHEEDFDDEDDDDDEEDDEVKESRGAAGGGSGVSAVGTGASSGGGSLSGPLPSSSTGAAVVSSGVDAPYQPYELTLFTGGAGGGGGGTVGGVGGAPLTHGRHLPSYDIFPGAHNHSGGHFFRTTKRTQLVFPALEKTIQWDEYGERIDPSVYRMSAEQTDANPLAKQNRNPSKNPTRSVVRRTAKPESKSRFDPFSANSQQLLNLLVMQHSTPGNLLTPGFEMPENVATKCYDEELEIPLRCELSFIDFENRSDGEALKKIITGLRPQEVILLGTNRRAVSEMAQHCRTVLQLKSDAIHTPTGLDIVNCTKEGDIYQARMKDSLVTGLRFTKIREYELAWVEADLVDAEMDTDDKVMEVDEENDAAGQRGAVALDALPVLVPPSGTAPDHATIFVNEPKLSDLKQVLLAEGLSAEFVSGVLVVENCVAIKRTETGRLSLEGVLSHTYYNVRSVLYRQFAIL